MNLGLSIGRVREAARRLPYITMWLLGLSLNVDATAAADSDSSGAGPRTTLPPVSIELVGNCVPAGAPRLEGRFSLLVDADVTAEGKAVNLTFAKDVEPWQEAAARCVIERATLNPATQEGVPVASQFTISLELRLTAASTPASPPRIDRARTGDMSDCYARSARRAGAEGKVEIELTVGTDGRVSRYDLPAGIERWQEVTARCVMDRIYFEPAKRNGVPFAADLKFPLSFSLVGNDPLTLAKLIASKEETDAAMLACYPVDRKDTATPNFRVTVNVRGWPSQVMLVETSGDKELDATGACVLKKLRYEPAKRGERPVMSTLLVPITVEPPGAT